MSLIDEANPLTPEQEIHKAAFARACRMAGGGSRMAAALGVSASMVSRWERMNYSDCPPGYLYSKIDAAAGYSCMLEAEAGIQGFSIRREEVQLLNAPLSVLAGIAAEDSGRAVRAALEADADLVIDLRELNRVEAEGKTSIANMTRMIEATRAKYEAQQAHPEPGNVTRMTGGARS